jgi:hypothetical protein
MSGYKAGDRVGAVESSNEKQVRLFGYGVYEGDHVRPDTVPDIFGTTAELRETAIEINGPEDQWTDAQRAAFELLARNPRIRLDSGDVVWGCQCWWGSEEKVTRSIGDREVVVVPVPVGN